MNRTDCLDPDAEALRAAIAAAVRILQQALNAEALGREQLARTAIAGAAVSDAAMLLLERNDVRPPDSGLH